MNGELRALMRYRSALGFWYARMFAAARDGREFNEQRPEPSDFIAAIDAFRLAVGAGIEIGSVFQYGRALATIGSARGRGEFWEDGLDPVRATRRAIVRAAAEIGRTTNAS